MNDDMLLKGLQRIREHAIRTAVPSKPLNPTQKAEILAEFRRVFASQQIPSPEPGGRVQLGESWLATFRHSLASLLRLPVLVPVAATATVLLVCSVFFLNPSIKAWPLEPSTGTKGPSADENELQRATWAIRPDFKKGLITYLLGDGTVLSGSLSNVPPDPNLYLDPGWRTYLITVGGVTKNGSLPVYGDGSLAVHAADPTMPANSRKLTLSRVDQAELQLQITATNTPNLPPTTISRKLRKTSSK